VQKLLREHGVEHVKHAGGPGSVGRPSTEQRSAVHASSDVSVRLDAAEPALRPSSPPAGLCSRLPAKSRACADALPRAARRHWPC
jgi:hypothetical protein